MVAVTEEKKHGLIPYPKPVPEREPVKEPAPNLNPIPVPV